MPGPDIEIMPTPRSCAVCGRATTQFSRSMGAPYCGRDTGELAAAAQEGFGAPLRGQHRWWRGIGRQEFARAMAK